MENCKDKNNCKKRNLYKQTLENWLYAIIEKKCEDGVVIISELDEELENSKHWLNAGLCIYDILVSLLENVKTYLQCYLVLPLSCSETSTNPFFS